MQHALIREPLSPASTVGQDDIQRLRSLLDTERSRRMAAETALSVGGGSVSSRRSGMCTPPSVGGGGGGGTPKSRSSSYASFNKQAFARDLDQHGQEVTSPKSMPPGVSGGGFTTPGRSRGGAGGAPTTPSRSYASLSNMHVGTPRAPRLSYSALHKFPSARAVEAHALEASSNGAKWARSAISRAGGGDGSGETKAEQLYSSLGQPQQSREQKQKMLLSVVTSILVHLFHCCRVEVRRRLRVRVDGLRAFVGEAEFVQLGSIVSGPGTGRSKASQAAAAGAAGATPGGVMAQDTHELLYGELRRRHRTIAGLGRKDLVTLSARVLSRALKTEAKKEIGRMLVHQTWPTFEPVVRSYLALFVECALQEPQIEFDEAAGKEEPFDPEKHRPLASFSAFASPRTGTTGERGPGLQIDSDTLEPGFETDDDSVESGSDMANNNNASPRPCCVVFPAVIASITRWPPSKAAKSGVILY
ncbi:unnamed protein product [Ectocarpus sp. 12 AP-2014]